MSRTRSQVVGWFCRRDENTTRGNWLGRLDYTTTQLMYLVGLSAVWRLPYVAYRNGGGAFWLIYFLLLVLLGIPLLYLESAWGQFAGVGAISMWNLEPICKGIGYAALLISFILSWYYAALCCRALLYCVRGFSVALIEETLSCGNSWNTPSCSGGQNDTFSNETMYDYYGPPQQTSAAVEFFENRVHGSSLYVMGVGSLEADSVGCLVATWILIFLAVGFGAKVLGKVGFGVAMFIYLAGFVFLIRAVTLPGSWTGRMYLFYPDWTTLSEYSVWTEALYSVFVTTGAGFGVISTLASFNHFTDHSNAESGIILFVVMLTQLIISRIVFSLVGFLALSNNLPLNEVMGSGPHLAYGTLFEALSLLEGRQGWIVLFYLTLFLMGFSTQMSLTFTVVTAVVDEFPFRGLRRSVWHLIMTGIVCVACCLFGLFFIATGGHDTLALVDSYSTIMVPLFVGCACLILSWIYGFHRFFTDVQLMYGSRPFPIWKAFWGVTCPFGLFLIWGYYMKVSTYHDEFNAGIGGALYIATLLPIGVYAAVYAICYNPTDVLQGPSPAWGPQVSKHRERYEATLSGQPGVAPQDLPSDEKATPV